MAVHKQPGRIIIIGFMGTGKTLFGTLLARRLGLRHADTDRIIEDIEKRSVRRIFKEKGEAYFRQLESRVLRKVLRERGIVVSTGGGIVLRSENRRLIKRSGLVIWTRSGARAILDRIKGSRARPLVNVKDRRRRVAELLKKRTPYYRSLADLSVRNNSSALRACVAKLVSQYFNKG